MQHTITRSAPWLIASVLFCSPLAQAATKSFVSYSKAQEFCSSPKVSCYSIRQTLGGYSVGYELNEGEQSGPQLGKGGDDG